MKKFLPYIFICMILAGLFGLARDTKALSPDGTGTCRRENIEVPLNHDACKPTPIELTQNPTPVYDWYPKGSDTATPPTPLPAPSPSDPGSCEVNGQITASTRGTCQGTFTPNATTQTQKPVANTGNSLYDSLSSCPSSFDGCVELIVYWLFYSIPTFLLGVVARFFDVIVALTLSSGIYARATFLGTAWTVVRDLSNIFFILILLYIAIQVILGIGGHDTKKMIAKVIIMALLINFSMFFTEVVIDASNLLALVFYNKINVVSINTEGQQIDYVPVISLEKAGVVDKDVAGAMYSYFDPTRLLKPEFFDQFRQTTYEWSAKGAFASTVAGAAIGTAIPIIGTGVGAAIGVVGYFISGYSNAIPVQILVGFIIVAGSIIAFTAYCFLIAGISFLARLIELWILLIFSPFAFMSSAIPLLEDIEYIGWKSWTKKLLKTAFMAPIFMFFMYFIFMLIQTDMFNNLVDRPEGTGITTGWMQTMILILIPGLVILILLRQATKYAKESSGKLGEVLLEGAKKAGGLALGLASGGAAVGLRASVGRIGHAAANSEWAKNWEATGVGGEQAMELFKAMGSGSFDVRGAKIGGKSLASATSLHLGEAHKGGFTETREKDIKKRQERAKEIEVGEDEKLKQDLNRYKEDLAELNRRTHHEIQKLDLQIQSAKEDAEEKARRATTISQKSEVDKDKVATKEAAIKNAKAMPEHDTEKLKEKQELIDAAKKMQDSDPGKAAALQDAEAIDTKNYAREAAIKEAEEMDIRNTDVVAEKAAALSAAEQAHDKLKGLRTQKTDIKRAEGAYNNDKYRVNDRSLRDLEVEVIPDAEHHLEEENYRRREAYAQKLQSGFNRGWNFFTSGFEYSLRRGANEAAHAVRTKAAIKSSGGKGHDDTPAPMAHAPIQATPASPAAPATPAGDHPTTHS